MLAPSLLAPTEFYHTPNSEKGGPTRKRSASPQLESESQMASLDRTQLGMERRISDITSDISLDNLLEGSRRKRNKFSSDLPLLPLPTPTANEQQGHMRNKSNTRNRADSASTTATHLQTPGRVSMPTPAPTTISDEDVALQLIRLGDPSLSPCKGPSNDSSSPMPTLTTAMHLKALHDEHDYAEHMRTVRREVDYPSSPPASVSDHQDAPLMPASFHGGGETSSATIEKHASGASTTSLLSESEVRLKEETDLEEEIDIPRPQNLPIFHDFGPSTTGSSTVSSSAGHDHSKKNGPSVGVRCTRCKKSKKGCDRQRPCGRCADANEDCVTEDESTGRRGRNNRGGRRKR